MAHRFSGREAAAGRTLCLSLCIAALAACSSSSAPATASGRAGDGWVGVWSAAPYGPYPLGPLSGQPTATVPVGIALPLPSVLPGNHASNQSFRMIVHPTLGGDVARLRFSNLMGETPLQMDAFHLAKSLAQDTPAIVPGTDVAVTFHGSVGVTIAPGAEAVSDPVPFSFAVGDDLAVSFHVVGAPFTSLYLDGHYELDAANAADGAAQTLPVDPGDGGFVELRFDQNGSYPFLTHDMADATLGASGSFAVGN